jgi:hypothetical protein
VRIALAIADIIKSEPDGVPSGILYIAAQQHGFTLSAYESCIELLIQAKLVRRSNNLLFYIGK